MKNSMWTGFLVIVVALSTHASASLTIMPLGDSITAGYDGQASPGYRLDLYNELSAQGIQEQSVGSYDPTLLMPYGQPALGYSPTLTALGENYINGYGGFSSQQILENLAGSLEPNFPDAYPFISNNGGYWVTGGGGTGRPAEYAHAILLMAGTNDYYSNLTASQSEQYIAGIINWFAVNRPGSTVFVASPPPSTGSGAYLEPDLAAIDSILKSDITPAQFPNAIFVDAYQSFLNSDGSVDSSLFSSDGVHPSDAGYQAIATDFDSALITSGVAVPEPASVWLIVATFAFARCRRRLA